VSLLHHLVFSGMLEGIARETKKTVIAGPEHAPPGTVYPRRETPQGLPS